MIHILLWGTSGPHHFLPKYLNSSVFFLINSASTEVCTISFAVSAFSCNSGINYFLGKLTRTIPATSILRQQDWNVTLGIHYNPPILDLWLCKEGRSQRIYLTLLGLQLHHQEMQGFPSREWDTMLEWEIISPGFSWYWERTLCTLCQNGSNGSCSGKADTT